MTRSQCLALVTHEQGTDFRLLRCQSPDYHWNHLSKYRVSQQSSLKSIPRDNDLRVVCPPKKALMVQPSLSCQVEPMTLTDVRAKGKSGRYPLVRAELSTLQGQQLGRSHRSSRQKGKATVLLCKDFVKFCNSSSTRKTGKKSCTRGNEHKNFSPEFHKLI